MIKEIILHTINIDRKNIKNYTLGLGIMFAFFSIFMSTSLEIGDKVQLHYNSAIGTMQIMIGLLFVFSSPNWVFSFRRTRPSTIQLLMLPASNMEKYVAKLVFSYVGFFVMCIVALIGADIVQAVYHLLIHHDANSVTYLLLKENNMIFVAGQYKDVPYFASLAVMVHSIYTLGASFFRRHAFIKTSGIMFSLSTLFTGLTSAGIFSLLIQDYEIEIHFFMDPELAANIIYYTINAMITLFCYWYAYRRFCKLTIG